ncbi:uncharacterized protein BDR25DRAFT_302131 [Lindgomyces ingoldianus]|uniref:Uncharacterized protein n=1 Tax=Lindgomyces ingoldianus TaxID=673940 RepID=A0ACB6R1V8_9PLEO|nr:uncharacterized protein BDR25DRAFT_302131 [Lindgomyces ingoldianus]KAF2473126.1 hypothetical protein BDR25DRAFT_302131 [Lindgomyces ingoldianus]
MAGAPSQVLAQLAAHLQKIEQDPSTPLDEQLLAKCDLFTTTFEYRTQLWRETRPLFLQLADLLVKLQQDPTPLVHFSLKLTEPYRFDDVKDVDFEMGLNLAAKPFHLLILSLLEKATASIVDAQTIANRPAVIQAVVRLWLCSDDAGISTKAANLLISLLQISKDEPGPDPTNPSLYAYGAGPVWKRLFHDKDVYSFYYQFTSLKPLPAEGEPYLNKRDKTVAQARLLEWLPRVGVMHWDAIISSQYPPLEQHVGLITNQGLLHYAALKMVDIADDLMHMNLIHFYSNLITTVTTRKSLTSDSSVSLDFMKTLGIHKSIIDLHTTESPSIEYSFVSGRTANYISDYASTYPEDFESSPEMNNIRQYVHRNIRKCESNDLHILASLPRASLLPRISSGLAWDDCVLLDIPLIRTTPEALKTLATVFHGPPKEEVTFPPTQRGAAASRRALSEQMYARILLSLYYAKNPSMFSEIVTHADTIAMKEHALATLVLLRSIIMSNWNAEPHDEIIPSSDPIYLRLQQFPNSGVDLILDPSISGGLLPYLLKPATTFSNLVGGRGDAENAAYQVAMAKFDVLKALGTKLEEVGGRQDVVGIVKKRLAEGPWGVSGSVGSRIGTLDL